jgi:hypothetical protein
MLMRFGLLSPLASAFRKTADERYARSARQHIEAFLRAYPVAEGWSPPPDDGATSYPARIGSTRAAGWLGTLPAFLGSQAFDDEFFETIVEASRICLSYLMENIYPGRNIRILHGDVLLLNGLRLSFLPESEAWREMGVRILNDAVERQLLPDGADMEGSPEYHCDVMYVLAAIWKLARAYPGLELRVPGEKIAAMFEYALAATRPDGALTSLNDTGYNPPQGNFGDHVARARSEFLQGAGLPERTPPPCRHFPEVGQVFLRDDWGPEATYVTFDATIRRGWHWHPSRNAIQLFANRRALLIDPGYPFQNEKFPAYGHKTAHHSTLNLNGWDQSHALARARLRQAPGYDLVEGLYIGGYWAKVDASHGEGIFGEHHRSLLWIRGRCIVVIDQLHTILEPGRTPTVESVWQLSEGEVGLGEDGRSAVTGHPDSNLLLLFPLVHDGMRLAVHKGEWAPMRGWVPKLQGVCYTPAPMVRLYGEAGDPWKVHLAMVLIPFEGTDAPQVKAHALAPGTQFADRTAGRLDLEWPDGSSDLIVWTGRLEEAIDRQRGVDTDAGLVHLQFDRAGGLIGGLAVDGHFLRCDAVGKGDLIRQVQRV